MSWLHLAVEANTPVVEDLQARAASPEERLTQIGLRVGVRASRHTESLFVLADRMSELLTKIELNMFNDATTVQQLYMPGNTQDAMREIITHWQRVTGKTFKGTSVPAPYSPPQPPRPTGRSGARLAPAP